MSNEEQLLRQILSELKTANKNLEKLASAIDGVERAVWEAAPEK